LIFFSFISLVSIALYFIFLYFHQLLHVGPAHDSHRGRAVSFEAIGARQSKGIRAIREKTRDS